MSKKTHSDKPGKKAQREAAKKAVPTAVPATPSAPAPAAQAAEEGGVFGDIAQAATESAATPVTEGFKLPPLPKMKSASSKARAERKPKAQKPCACGCGGLTQGFWYPGHDARARSWALRVERDLMKLEDVPDNERAGAKYMYDERRAAGIPLGHVVGKGGMTVIEGGKGKKEAVNE